MEAESIRVTSTYISTSILNGSNLLVGVQKHCHNTHTKTLSLKNSCAKTVAASVLPGSISRLPTCEAKNQ